jgi:peptide deformylase
MIREIVHYDAPVLRAKGKPVTLPASKEVRIDVTGIKERPSKMWIKGQPVDPEAHMPVILINPEVKPTKTKVTSHEGCLSFPGLTLDIARATRVSVKTRTLEGGTVEFDAAGLLGRAVLHEVDHLHGKLFIDLITAEERKAIREDLECIKRGEPIPEPPEG